MTYDNSGAWFSALSPVCNKIVSLIYLFFFIFLLGVFGQISLSQGYLGIVGQERAFQGNRGSFCQILANKFLARI